MNQNSITRDSLQSVKGDISILPQDSQGKNTPHNEKSSNQEQLGAIKSNQELKPDIIEARKHFRLLGRSTQEIRLRFINPVTGKSSKSSADADLVLRMQEQGFNVYLVVNAGGDIDKDISKCHAIWYEHDNLDPGIQVKLWITLNLPEPTFQIHTGGKSIHSYWVFANPVEDVGAWKSLQSDLLEFSDGDRSIKNPSRVMRMAGGVYYSKSGEPKGVAKIISESGKRYSFEELREIIPIPSAKTTSKPIPPVEELQPNQPKPVNQTSKPTPVSKPTGGKISFKDSVALIEAMSGDIAQYDWDGHQFKRDATDANKWRGYCPFHQSETGTSFVVSNNKWYCAGEVKGGTLLEYKALREGRSLPLKGKEYREFVREKFGHVICDPRVDSPQSREQGEQGEQGKRPIQDYDVIVDDFRAELGGNLKFVASQKSFFRYMGTHWEMVEDSEVLNELRRFVRQSGYLLNSSRKLSELLGILKLDLSGELASNDQYLAFEDVVLNLNTWLAIPHSREIGNTWKLPRKYQCDNVETPTIDRFLADLTNSNLDLIAKIKCFFATCLRGNNNHQKFIHLLGVAGSGKGTLLRLFESFIGSENAASSSLAAIEGDKFEGFNLVNRKLVILPDEHRQPRHLETFLKLIGNDSIRCERKYKDAFYSRFNGSCIVASNFEVFGSEAPDAVARRRIIIPCQYKPSQPDINLLARLQEELPALTRQVLEIPPDTIAATLASASPVSAIVSWEERTKNNSIAAWMNDHCFLEVGCTSAIGRTKDEVLGDNGLPKTLYGSYGLFCRMSGYQPVSLNRFSADIVTTARTFFGHEVEKFRSKSSRGLRGIRLRADYEATMDECMMISLLKQMGDNLKPMGDNLGDTGDNLGDNPKPLLHKESDGGDNLLQKKISKKKIPDSNSSPESETGGIKESDSESDNSKKDFSKKVVTPVTPEPETQSEQELQPKSKVVTRLSPGCHPLQEECVTPEPENQSEQAFDGGDNLDYDGDNLDYDGDNLTIDNMKLGDSYIFLSPGVRQGMQCHVTAIGFDDGYPVIEIQFPDGFKSYPQPSQLGRIE